MDAASHQITRHLLEAGAHPHNTERNIQADERQDQGKTGIQQAHATDLVVQRSDQGFERNGQTDEEQHVDQALARHLELSEGITAERAEDHHAGHDHDHQNAAVEQQRGDVCHVPGVDEVLPVRVGSELDTFGHGTLRLQCRGEHAQERQYAEEDGQSEHRRAGDANGFGLLHGHCSFPLTRRCRGPTTSSTRIIRVTASAEAKPTLCWVKAKR